MLTADVVGTGRTAGEVRPPRCETGWNRVAGDPRSGRGGNHAAANADVLAFRLPVGPIIGYFGVNQGPMVRLSGKCRMNVKHGRAVIVEDNTQMRQLIQVVLESLGIKEIVSAANGAEAISALQTGGTDIVFMDWRMDVMDGLECTRRIRAGVDGVDPKTAIVMVTGMGGEKNSDTAYAAGVDLFIEKPISVKILLAGVEKILGRLPG
ncbi:response regulator [Magnetospirillum sp. UT-4]|uniref:response regulator n=1 Tax=Magnetospirillum sp. UT-4 TaxID=2681467 RepID=UPI00352F409B